MPRRLPASENRRTMRYVLATRFILHDGERPVIATLQDISIQGMGFACDATLVPGQEVQAEIVLCSGGTPLHMVGRVAWTRGTRCGIRFTRKDPHFARTYLRWGGRELVSPAPA